MLNTNYQIFGVCIIVFFLSITKCEICNKRVTVQVRTKETYRETYIEQYNGDCWFSHCIKTRIDTNIAERPVLKTIIEDRDECCAGYTEDYLAIQSKGELQCKPICSPACEQGFCKTPGQCACYTGYELHQIDKYKCLPICTNGCDHGSCVRPDTCECNSNYTMLENGSCIPLCSSGCPKGICISPEVCKCNTGWQNNEVGVCEPYCNRACGNGTCTEPDVCECFPGFKLNVDNGLDLMNTLCVPECIGCNGTCLAPKHCSCDIPFEAVAVTEDGQECDCNESCSGDYKQCHHTACILKDIYYISTTDIVSISTGDEMISTIYGEVSNDSDATDNVSDHVSSSTSSYNTDGFPKCDKSYGISSWVYIIISSIIIITLVVLSVTICTRSHITPLLQNIKNKEMSRKAIRNDEEQCSMFIETGLQAAGAGRTSGFRAFAPRCSGHSSSRV